MKSRSKNLCWTNLTWTLAPLVVFCISATAEACPTCRDAIAGDPAAASLIQGYFISIIFMISMPFLILAGLSSYFYYEVWKARRARAAQGAQPDEFKPGFGLLDAPSHAQPTS